MKIKNIAIIAHVDHGKTSLVDSLLKSTETFRENEIVDTCVMDSNDIEKNVELQFYLSLLVFIIKTIKLIF